MTLTDIRRYHAIGGVLVRRGLSIPDPGFVLGVTPLVPGVNVGVDPAVTLTAYTGPGAGGLVTPAAGTTYVNKDFGNTRFKRTASDVHFVNCKWTNTAVGDIKSGDPGPMIDCRGGTNFSNWTFDRCSFENTSQWAPLLDAVQGYGYSMNRCSIRGYSDGLGTFVPSSRPDTAIDVQLKGVYIGQLSWWWAPTTGVVHPSGQWTHNDLIQHQGGRGLWIEGCLLDAHYSTTVGTGTPNSGSDTGASAAPYTQADGQAARTQVVDGNGTYAGNHLGGSISAIMVNSVRGKTPAMTVLNNWGGGGSYWLNAGDTGLTGDFGTISGNRIDPNQRIAGYAFGLRSVLTAVVSGNSWSDGSGVINRRNA